MGTVIKIIGVIIVSITIVFLVKPQVMRRLMVFFKKGNRIYLAGLIRLALAVVFLLGARECDITWVIVVFGILFLISGLLVFMLGPAKIGRMLDWYEKRSLILSRFLAAIILAVGAIIICSA
jgi:membrane glycosyltransferase